MGDGLLESELGILGCSPLGRNYLQCKRVKNGTEQNDIRKLQTAFDDLTGNQRIKQVCGKLSNCFLPK